MWTYKIPSLTKGKLSECFSWLFRQRNLLICSIEPQEQTKIEDSSGIIKFAAICFKCDDSSDPIAKDMIDKRSQLCEQILQHIEENYSIANIKTIEIKLYPFQIGSGTLPIKPEEEVLIINILKTIQ